MNKQDNNWIKRKPLTAYFFLAFLISWLILSPGIAGNLGLIEFNFDGTVLTILSTLGPFLAALIVRNAEGGGKGIRETVHSMFNWRVGWKWWAASVLLIGILTVIAVLVTQFIDMPGMESGANQAGQGIGLGVTMILFLLGSFGEETGWRGLAIPKLQGRFKPFAATLILTAFWWIWHIPTYWTLPAAMASREQFGFVMAFSVQSGVLLALGILCAWVFNGSKGSILMPVLLHATWNICSFSISQGASTILLPLFLISAIVVLISTRGRLGFNPENQD
jgi:membrane protease YdiL (CAAX protease family)